MCGVRTTAGSCQGSIAPRLLDSEALEDTFSIVSNPFCYFVKIVALLKFPTRIASNSPPIKEIPASRLKKWC